MVSFSMSHDVIAIAKPFCFRCFHGQHAVASSVEAREAGLKFPVYLTGAVWENYVRVPDGVRCQDEQGRLWDVVWMLRCAARRTNGPQMRFKLHVRNDNRDRTPPLVTLQAVCGPRDIDDPAPGITIMLPDEDGRAHRPDDLRQRAMCGPAR